MNLSTLNSRLDAKAFGILSDWCVEKWRTNRGEEWKRCRLNVVEE